MHEQDRAHHEQRERLEILHVLFTKRRHVDAASAVSFGMRRGDSGRDRLQFGAGLFDGDAVLHLADAIEEEVAARIVFLIHLQRHPDVAKLGEPPAVWHHADHGDLLPIDWNNLADDAAVAAEMILPNLVTNQRHRSGIEVVFLGTK